MQLDQIDDRIVRARQRHLLRWYDAQGRDLPWRRRPTLYGTWIAETMLQQTTVATVSGRWRAFLDRFCDASSLAEAAESEVLAAWSGLGYYRRARNLHRAARLLRDHHDGRLPRTVAGWRALPGVGDYAAGAIASIGLGLPVAAIDANVRRVLSRWHCADAAAANDLTVARVRALAEAHVSSARPGDWNQALMDLGAEHCRPGEAACTGCPVQRWCAAGLAGASAQVPAQKQRARPLAVTLGSLVLKHRDELLLLPSERAIVAAVGGLGRPVRRELGGLLAGLWSQPLTAWYADPLAPSHSGTTATRELAERSGAAWRRWLRSLGWPQPRTTGVGMHRHAITTHRLRVHVSVAEWPPQRARPELPGAFWTADVHSSALSSLARLGLALSKMTFDNAELISQFYSGR